MKMLALVVLAVGYFIAAASAAAAVGKKALPAEDGTATHVRKKVRLHQVAHNQLYGVDLPAFAFDYSELLASAVIERSENLRDLYLTIFLLGHQAIFQNGYISALQTDQDNVLAWRQAAQQWQRDRQHNQTSHSRSRLFCVLHHNDHPRAQAYQVPAYWLSAQASVVNAGLEVLRCKLRNPSTIFSNYTHQSSKRLFVDLIRRNPAESVVSSFSIPWRERSIGYGSLAVRSPALSLWSFTQPNRSEGDLRPLSANRLARHSKHPRGSGGSGGLRGENMNSNSSSSGGGAGGGPVQPILHACVPGVRPVQARPQVPIASLMEFLGHLQVLNVSHTTLGLVVDGQEKSYFMAKHVYALSAAIASGQVSLSALSWPQYDDVPGFLGVMLSTSLADSLFLNHCFSLSRGKADYVLVLRPFQFWLPAGFTARQLGQETERWTWLQFFQQSRTRPMEAGAGIGAGRYTSRYLDSHSANRSVTMTTSPPASLAGHNSSHSRQALSCSLVLTERFAVEDPSNALFPPGDSTWIQEFYASSRMQRLRASHNAIRLLNTQHTLAIEVVHEQILPVCKAPSWQLPRVVERQVSGDLAVELSFVERISPENALPSPSRVQNDQFRQVAPTENPGGSQPARETWRMQLFQHTHAQLAQLHWTLPSWPIFQREFLQRSMSRDHTNESAESSTPLTAASDNVGTTGNVKDRSAVKPPFWKMCDRQPLAEVALSIFQA